MTYIDQMLINVRPKGQPDNEQFVRRTMAAVQEAQSRETFKAEARKTNVTKKETFMTKILTMPKLASATLGLGALLITGGGVYAAMNWFGTHVSTEQRSGTVYSVTAECSPSKVQALQNTKPYTNTAEYKITKPQLISEEDLKLDELSTCEQRAIESNLRVAMPDVYQPVDSQNGLYYPVGKYGTVVSSSDAQVVVAGISVDRQNGQPEVITAPIVLNANTQVTDRGKNTNAASFKPGDHVYFIFQNPVRSGQNDNDWRATPSSQSTVRAIAKTQYDMAAIKGKVFKASAEGAFEVLKKSDAFGG